MVVDVLRPYQAEARAMPAFLVPALPHRTNLALAVVAAVVASVVRNWDSDPADRTADCN